MTSDPKASDTQAGGRWIPLESNPEVRVPHYLPNSTHEPLVNFLYRIYRSGFQLCKPKLHSAVVVLKPRRSVVSKGGAHHFASALRRHIWDGRRGSCCATHALCRAYPDWGPATGDGAKAGEGGDPSLPNRQRQRSEKTRRGRAHRKGRTAQSRKHHLLCEADRMLVNCDALLLLICDSETDRECMRDNWAHPCTCKRGISNIVPLHLLTPLHSRMCHSHQRARCRNSSCSAKVRNTICNNINTSSPHHKQIKHPPNAPKRWPLHLYSPTSMLKPRARARQPHRPT